MLALNRIQGHWKLIEERNVKGMPDSIFDNNAWTQFKTLFLSYWFKIISAVMFFIYHKQSARVI